MIGLESTARSAPKEPANDGGSALDEHWIKLADCPELLIDKPPKQVWLLDRYHNQRDVGVLPRGRTGLLTGTGGVSKTMLLIQLAVAVGISGFWLDTFRVATSGHVLLALGEEDRDEAIRRLWRVCNALELDADQRREVAQRIDVVPLAGVPVALTHSPSPGVVVATQMAANLRQRLVDRGVEWALIVIEPLSRWAGGGIEADNEAATRFCQIVETFNELPGRPTVLLAHHSSKISAKDGASDARGVTGIRDGFRWMAAMDAFDDEHGREWIRFRNRKSNYSAKFPDLILARNDEPGAEGTVRLATAVEVAELTPTKKDVTDEEIEARVLETVAAHSGLTSATGIADITQGTRSKVFAVVKSLRAAKRLVLEDGQFVVAEPKDETNQ